MFALYFRRITSIFCPVLSAYVCPVLSAYFALYFQRITSILNILNASIVPEVQMSLQISKTVLFHGFFKKKKPEIARKITFFIHFTGGICVCKLFDKIIPMYHPKLRFYSISLSLANVLETRLYNNNFQSQCHYHLKFNHEKQNHPKRETTL